MGKTILLTSFTTWLPHQRSNAADDLLLALLDTNPPPELHFLRQIPVDFELAPQQAIARITELKPDLVVCCGMAESRTRLSVESRAVMGEDVRCTRLAIDRLVAGLPDTEISHDAGRFVCNALYYALLKHLQATPIDCLFVHVPILHDGNREGIVRDFCGLLGRVGSGEVGAIDEPFQFWVSKTQ